MPKKEHLPSVSDKEQRMYEHVKRSEREQGRSMERSKAIAAAWAGRRYDLLDAAPVRTETCLYTNTPDEQFIVERRGGVIIGSACSGHGFKFAPAIGDRLADLALEALAS